MGGALCLTGKTRRLPLAMMTAYPHGWKMFEELCEMISGQDDIFYGTNAEVFEYTLM